MTLAYRDISSFTWSSRLVTSCPDASYHSKFSIPQVVSANEAPRFQVATWLPVFLNTMGIVPFAPGSSVAAGLVIVTGSSLQEYDAWTDTGILSAAFEKLVVPSLIPTNHSISWTSAPSGMERLNHASITVSALMMSVTT